MSENQKPTRPKAFTMVDVGGNNVVENKTHIKQTTASSDFGDKADKEADTKSYALSPPLVQIKTASQSKVKRIKKSPMENNSEELLFALAKLGPNSIDELLALVTRLKSMSVEQLLENPEGMIYLASKYGYSFIPELPLEMNRFIAKANLLPKTKAHLTKEERQLSYAERYPHMQVSRKYKIIIDTIAHNANVPATVIMRMLLDMALGAIGVDI